MRLLRFLGTLVCLIVMGFILTMASGCVSGVRLLGEIDVAPGFTKKYVQIGSEGHDGAKITVIEPYLIVDENKPMPGDPYVAKTDGLLGKTLQGIGAAGMAAGGNIGAAYLRKPDVYNSSTVQSGGGADVATDVDTSSSALSEGSKAGALSISKSKSSPRVYTNNDLKNFNRNTVTNTNTTTSSGGCPGNSCGQGGNGNPHND